MRVKITKIYFIIRSLQDSNFMPQFQSTGLTMEVKPNFNEFRVTKKAQVDYPCSNCGSIFTELFIQLCGLSSRKQLNLSFDSNFSKFFLIFPFLTFSYFSSQKSLYSEEMNKKSQKNDEKLQEFRTENQFLKRKNDEHEAQIDRLTKQLLTFKDLKTKHDEAVRENDFMRSKLRFMEKNGGMSMTGSIGMSRMPSTTPRLNIAGTQMEDEAGEEFNNTYLKDLKFGSDFSLDKPVNDVCSASVLQQRNSMYPQHMRDSYAVINLDRNVGEEEMRVRK